MPEENVEIIKRAIERWNKGEPIPMRRSTRTRRS